MVLFRFCMVWIGLSLFGLVWYCWDWYCMVWYCSVWFGLLLLCFVLFSLVWLRDWIYSQLSQGPNSTFFIQIKQIRKSGNFQGFTLSTFFKDHYQRKDFVRECLPKETFFKGIVFVILSDSPFYDVDSKRVWILFQTE